MKNLARKRLLLALAAGAALVASGVSNADQTRAGTPVSNSATLTFLDLGLLNIDVTGIDPTDPQQFADAAADAAAAAAAAGDGLMTPVLAPAVFIVDERLDQDLTFNGAPVNVTPGGPLAGTFYVAPFTVTNEGNAPINVVIDAEQLATGDTRPLRVGEVDNFDLANFTVYLDNGDGVFDGGNVVGGDQIVLDPDATAGNVKQAFIPLDVVADDQNGVDATESEFQVVGESATLFLVVEGPNGVVTPDANGDDVAPGEFALVELTSTAVDINGGNFDNTEDDNATDAIRTSANDPANTVANDDTTVETIFADGRDPDTLANEVPDAQDRATASFVNEAANFVFSKTDEIICDPINGFADTDGTAGGTAAENQGDAYHIPGAIVRYTITIENNGNAGALLTAMTDQLQGDISFSQNFIDQDNGTDENSDDVEGADVCDAATDFSVPVDATTTPADPGNGGGNTAGPLPSIRTILTGPDRNEILYHTPVILTGPPPLTPPTGAFALVGVAATGVGSVGDDGGGGQLLTFILAEPISGPLQAPAGAPPTPPALPTLPGQLNPGETLRIQFNARIR